MALQHVYLEENIRCSITSGSLARAMKRVSISRFCVPVCLLWPCNMYILMEVGSNSISESREGKVFSEVSSSVSDTEIAKGRDREGQRTSFLSS